MQIGSYSIQITSFEDAISEVNSLEDIHEEKTCYQIIICNKIERKMAILNGMGYTGKLVELNASHIDNNAIIDLDRNGSRWEGGMLDDKPFGWGRRISGKDNVVYEGFEYNGQRVCCGEEYCDNVANNRMTFCGYYLNSRRVGHCISYDLHGEVEFEGKWPDPVDIEKDGMISLIPGVYMISILLEELVIGSHSYNSGSITVFELSPLLYRLRRIEIGAGCFQKVCQFAISGLERLEQLKIGNTSFKRMSSGDVIGLCHICNCPNLQELVFGDESCCYYKSLELRSLVSLRSIVFGKYCFWCTDLNLHGIISCIPM